MKTTDIITKVVSDLLSAALSRLPKQRKFNLRSYLAASVLFAGIFVSGSIYAGTTGSYTPGGTFNVNTDHTTMLGTGPSWNNNTMTVLSDVHVNTGNSPAISLGNGVSITIEAGAVVENTAAGSGGTAGNYSAGKNTIEFNNNGTLTIKKGATVRANSSAGSTEAINIIGGGNKIVNEGSIEANGAAIWFQEVGVSAGTTTTIENSGDIKTGSTTGVAISFSDASGGGSSSNVHFTNYTGGYVQGNLSFKGGDDTLTLYPNSTITGGFDGGGGINTIELVGDGGTSGTFDGQLVGSVSNFDYLVKAGLSHWELTGTVGSAGRNLAVQVKYGTLTLSGNNTNFQGTVTVDTPGILEARAQSLPGVPITDNGIVRFINDDTGTYNGVITGSGSVEKTGTGTVTLTGTSTYTGGTVIKDGAFSISADQNIGAGTGKLTLDGGTLINTAAITMGRAVEITNKNGTFQTNANLTLNNSVTGAGKLTKTGNGDLILSATNTYSGGTSVQGNGALVLKDNGTIFGDVALSDAGSKFRFNKSGAYTFSGDVSGNGSIEQIGAGTITLTGNNSYKGGTSIANNTTLVVGNGGTTGTLGDGNAVTINGSGHLSFNRGNQYTFNGNLVTGTTGSVTQDGSGRTILTGNNAGLTGIVEVNSGTLQAGDGNNNSSINNAASITVANNAELAFKMPNITFGKTINGAGKFTQLDGTTVFTADQAYTGKTLIDTNGTVQLGNGGTTGSINAASDIELKGNLIFNRSDDITADNNISGTGNVVKNGSGALTVADNKWAYTGTTTLNDGVVFVNGDLSNSSLTTVNNGGWLSGTGTIGTTEVKSGGILSAGDVLGAAGTLTVNGNLTMDSGSVVYFNKLETPVSDQQVNDLINVNGDLKLSGAVLHILDTAGNQTFKMGVYRIFNYTGDLLDGSLVIGDMWSAKNTPTLNNPSRVADNFTVQTAVNGQVNLVNTAGLDFYYWDTKDFNTGNLNDLDNGVVSGGTGIWNNNQGQINWTEYDGAFNVYWSDSKIAIFQGEAGTVTVSNNDSQVTAGGMQFLESGYLVNGGDLELVNNTTTNTGWIRVGTGLANSASITATVDTKITGNGTILEKEGYGTLILTKDNTYTGGTLISGGTLQIAKDTNLGQAGTDLTMAGGTLKTTSNISTSRPVVLTIDPNDFTEGGTFETDAGTTLTLTTAVTGNGNLPTNILLTKTGGGNLELTAANTYNGGTKISDGSITLSGAATMPGDVELDAATKSGSLVFNRTDSYVYAGVISGDGTVRQNNTGTTIFTGNNTYQGTTEIAAGKLQIGNSGTSGTLGDGNVTIAGSGELIFNRSNSLTVDNTISGTGAVTQNGSGTTMLTANNSYKGATTVKQGTLYIDGDQTAATGTTTVENGATLGGIGTLGGSVIVESGGILSPGDTTTPIGTLTINQNLTLDAGAVLSYSFGQANVEGGPLNDLTIVKGNLVLDGTINVDLTSSGSFGPGVYRVISYEGNLTDNTLDIGTLPNTENKNNWLVQTAIDHQVNLINTAGLTLTWWDTKDFNTGNPADLHNGNVSGGTGIWNNDANRINWTDDNGLVNAKWTDAEFAIFAGEAGTVTVSNAYGQVTTEGMQFMVDGYLIAGDKLELVNNTSTNTGYVRVGDGTMDGASFTATIAAEITGNATLQKDGLGTLVLTGDNTYNGGTLVSEGTLRISKDTNLGQAGTGLTLYGGTTLNTTGSITTTRSVALAGNSTFETDAGTTLTLTTSVTGSGSLTKTGSGDLELTAANSYIGGTKISNGSVILSNAGTIVGDVELDASTKSGSLIFDKNANYTYGGVISGEGTVKQQGTGTTLTLTGNNTYKGTTEVTAGNLQLGGGSTTGSIDADSEIKLSAGTNLIFNRSDALTSVNTITGAGNVVKSGSGDLTVTDNNNFNYSGTTTVQNGTLYVNGDLSNSSQTTVNSGATIGGDKGTTGNLTVQSGGTLSPGDSIGSVGTLTVQGNLVLNSGTELNYDFGKANEEGGPYNDLTIVTGNLTLGGTINVGLSTTSGSQFKPGVYRVIKYDGTLTNPNGLSIGTMGLPANRANWSVQTFIPKQVNLINTGGLDFTWWDTKDYNANDLHNSNISGGTGIWNNDATRINWTDENGLVNAKWTDSEFALFAGEAGTVTVSNATYGQVKASGMQFLVDGYLIAGDKLELVNNLSTGTGYIVVGIDSTDDSRSMTATIASEITGNGTVLEKDGVGRLVLQGTNTYTGGTKVSDGMLQISKDSNLGATGTSLTLYGGSTLNTTADIDMSRNVALAGNSTFETDGGTKLTLQTAVTGAGSLTKTGTGDLELTAANTYNGGTKISNGSVILSDAGTIPGDVELDASTKAGSLVFNKTSNDTYSGVISGEGTVKQQGTGTTVLTGNNTYKGTTEIAAGKVRVGDSGTTGTLGDSDVRFTGNDGTLTFDRTDTYEFGGSITGGAGNTVAQSGSGTTVLKGNNTAYTGDVYAGNGGTLQIGNGTGTDNSSINNAANIAVGTGSTIAFNLPDEKFSNTIAGSGNFVQMAGKTTFTGDQTYTGSTTINNGGTVQIGDEHGTNNGAGSIASSSIMNNGSLVFDKNTEYTTAAAITGSGSLRQSGSGKLILTANNTYQGGTIIDTGSELQLGNGGTTGSVINGITDNGTLIFNHSNELNLLGTISGTGNIIQTGTGNTVLSGNNTYSGTALVENGGLYINGNQTGTGLTTVNSGGTIGGTGTIGGSVNVQSGGILNPGSTAQDFAGTLTINKDLILDDGAVLQYNFGKATNIEGGAYNDLTIVKGDLTLNGTIDVELTRNPSDSKFTIGVYRVIKYDGTLTDNELEIGTLPISANERDYWHVQTAIDKQVNLVYTAGQSLNFWDGDNPLNWNNEDINGGQNRNGVWVAGSDEKWTDEKGIVNSGWKNGWFAIFTATPGTVTVNTNKGDVVTSGMQFDVDGYEITGDNLTLVGIDDSSKAPDDTIKEPGTAVIRVGSGHSDYDKDKTAKISANLVEKEGEKTALTKTDAGTLILTGQNNSYSGGTFIKEGTIKGNLPENDNLTVDKGALYDGSNGDTNVPAARKLHSLNGEGLVKNTNDLTVATGDWGGNIDESNVGKLIKVSDETLTLSGTNTFKGITDLQGGTLVLKGDGSISDSGLVMRGGTIFDISQGNSKKTLASLGLTKETEIYLGKNNLDIDGKTIAFDIQGYTPGGSIITQTYSDASEGGKISMDGSTVDLSNVDMNGLQIGVNNKIYLIKDNVIYSDFSYDPLHKYTGTSDLHFICEIEGDGLQENDLILYLMRDIDPRTKILLNNGLASMAMLNQSQNWLYDTGFGLLDKQSYISPCERAGTLDITGCGGDSDDCGKISKWRRLVKNWTGFGGFEGGTSRYNPGAGGSIFNLDSYHLHAGLGKVKHNAYGYLTYGGQFEAGYGHLKTSTVGGKGNTDYYGGQLFVRQALENSKIYFDTTFSFGNTDTKSDIQLDPKFQKIHLVSHTPYVGASAGIGRVNWVASNRNIDTFVRYFYTRRSSDSVTLSAGDPLYFDTIESNRLQLGARVNFLSTTTKNVRLFTGAVYEYEFSDTARGMVWGEQLDQTTLRGGNVMGEVGCQFLRGAWSVDMSVRGYTGKRESVSGYAGFGYRF